MGLEGMSLFDTHPSNGDRIRRARQANAPGVFDLDAPARALFSNFEVPARQVTLLHYADDLDLPVAMALLTPVAPSDSPSDGTEPAPSRRNVGGRKPGESGPASGPSVQ